MVGVRVEGIGRGGVVRSRNGFRGQEQGGIAGHAGARAEGGGCGGGQARTERFRGLAVQSRQKNLSCRGRQVRAEGVRAWGGACRGQGRGGRVRWGWTSGLGGVGRRGRASTHGAFLWVFVGWWGGHKPDKKN